MSRLTIEGQTETVDTSQPAQVLTFLRDRTLARLKTRTAEKERHENAAIAAASDVETLTEALGRYIAAIAAVEAAAA